MIIGQPKTIAEFQPLPPEQIDHMAGSLEAALSQGMPLNMPAAVDLGTLCVIMATLRHFAARVKTLEEPLPTLPRITLPDAE